MSVTDLAAWLDDQLDVASFDDVSNNGLQIACRTRRTVKKVAVAVDASAANVRTAAAAGAQLLVVHHGISWGGGIRRIDGGVYNVVRAAMDADLALYACHLPLDASEKFGNNWELARHLGLRNVRKAFSYHGNVIGVVGTCARRHEVVIGHQSYEIPKGTVGVCSGGAGEFAEAAKALGCDLYLTGEASWGDVIAAENVGQKMVCAGHYETETFGVRALGRFLARQRKLQVIDLTGDGE